jgi:hypothetical protein
MGADAMSARANRMERDAELASINAAISAHPFSSPPVLAASSIIEEIGKENSEQVAAALAERGLPSLAELGRIHVAGTTSWWRLHRARRAIEKKMSRLTQP